MSESTFEKARGKFFARKGRKLAYSMTSPSTIVLTGVVGAAAIALGAPALVIAGVAAGAYAVKVAAQTFSPSDVADILNPKVSLAGLRDPFREWVHRGLAAKERYRDTLKETPPGPLHDRLGDTADEMDDVLAGLVKIARRAQKLDDFLQSTSARNAAQQLGAARARLDETSDPDMARERERIVNSFEEQVAVTNRIRNTYDRTTSRMESTVANLDQLSAQLVEVNLTASDAGALPDPTADVDDLVSNLHAVRDGLAEIDEVTEAEVDLEFEAAEQALPRQDRLEDPQTSRGTEPN